MPTLDALAGSVPLRFATGRDAADYGGRTVSRVWRADHARVLPASTRGLLVVVDDVVPWLAGARADSALRSLAGAGVAALAVHESIYSELTLADLARHHRLPALRLGDDISWQTLASTVSDLGWREEADSRRRLQELHGLVRQMTDAGGAEGVLGWLRRYLGAGSTVVLVRPYETPDLDDRQLDALAVLRAGRRKATADLGGTSATRMYALGHGVPHTVLVVTTAGGGLRRAAGQVIGEALPGLELALTLRRSADVARRQMSGHLLHLLACGQVALAQRAARPARLAPGLLSAPAVRVYHVSGGPGRGEGLVGAMEHLLGPDGLAAAVADNGIVAIGREDPRLERALHDLVAGRPGMRAGVSLPVPLDQVAAAERMAARALAVSGHVPCRVAYFRAEQDLAMVLPAAPARAWATDLLSPLDTWRPAERRAVVETTGAWLRCGTGGAARIAGITPNGVRKRVVRTAEALDLDLSLLGHRVALDLAVRIETTTSSSACVPGDTGGPGTPGLEDLLEEEMVRAWAGDLFDRLPSAGVRQTVVAWLAAGAHTREAADRLGLHYKVVQRQLGRAEVALGRRLLSYPASGGRDGAVPAGLHDTALAALALGELRLDALLAAPTRQRPAARRTAPAWSGDRRSRAARREPPTPAPDAA